MDHGERVTPVQPIFLINLRDHVHENLRKAIIAGRFVGEERLNERDLARDLGVSTTPLKEALRQPRDRGPGADRTEARRFRDLWRPASRRDVARPRRA